MIGQSVQFVKDKSPQAVNRWRWHNLSMRAPMTPAEYDSMYIARVKALRRLKGLSADKMATALGIPADRYRKYETRTVMPHALMEQFAIITDVSLEFLVTGRRVAGKGPYPDVPGPHMLDEWRAANGKPAEADSD